MSFDGMPGQVDSNREPSIVLVWGDGPRAGSRVLWRSNP